LSQVLDEEYDLVEKVKDFDIKPRVPDEVYIPPEVQVIRPKWKLPVSIFRTFRIDSPVSLA